MSNKVPEGYIKCKIGVIYSENETQSLESKNLAFWLAASLADTGYAQTVLIAYNGDNVFDVPAQKRIRYYPFGKSKPQDAPLSDCTFGSLG